MNRIRKYMKGVKRRYLSYRAILAAKLRRDVVAAGYYNRVNFGDQLTPELLRFFGLIPIHTPIFGLADVIGVGSILHLVPDAYTGVILGSGFIDESCLKQFPVADIRLVRGNLTRIRLGLKASIAVGDPGLIVDSVYHDQICGVEKQYSVGIVPHYVDQLSAIVQNLKNRIGSEIKIINVFQDPESVVMEMAVCSHILSSSLHGLVVADSLGIPNRWIILSNKIIGGGYKFNDYYSAYNIKKIPLEIDGGESIKSIVKQTEKVSADQVAKVKEGVHNSFSKFADDILSD